MHKNIYPALFLLLGEAKPDWWIISALAEKILAQGKRQVQKAEFSGWEYQDTAQIMSEIAALTPI